MIDLARGEMQAGRDVLIYQGRVFSQNLLTRHSGCQHLQNVDDPDPKIADAWTSAALTDGAFYALKDDGHIDSLRRSHFGKPVLRVIICFLMTDHIRETLSALANEEDVRVLLAVESGSRAWGFESADSDWDVRFVYVRSADAYLSINQPRDVIERNLPNDLDLAGWDLPKALRLFAKSNPALLEWMRSPIVYAQDESFVSALRELEPRYMVPRSGLYHYCSMAMTNHRDFLQAEEVRLKKYFYVLRPILACLFLERTGNWPPVRFAELVETEVDDPALRSAIEELVAVKVGSGELGTGPRIAVLDQFIEPQLERLQGLKLDARTPADVEPLNLLLRAQIGP